MLARDPASLLDAPPSVRRLQETTGSATEYVAGLRACVAAEALSVLSTEWREIEANQSDSHPYAGLWALHVGAASGAEHPALAAVHLSRAGGATTARGAATQDGGALPWLEGKYAVVLERAAHKATSGRAPPPPDARRAGGEALPGSKRASPPGGKKASPGERASPGASAGAAADQTARWHRGCIALVASLTGDGGAWLRVSRGAMAAALGPGGTADVLVRPLASLKGLLRAYAATGALTGPLLSWASRFEMLPPPASANPPPLLSGPAPPHPAFAAATAAAAAFPPASSLVRAVGGGGALPPAGGPRPSSRPSTPLPPLPRALLDALARECNPPQRHFISECATRTEGICLLQGPPGTGKTRTITRLLSALLAQPPPRPPSCASNVLRRPVPGAKTLPSRAATPLNHPSRPHRRLLVCAPSNAALDELVARLLDDGLLDANGVRHPLHTPDVTGAHCGPARLLRLGSLDNTKMASRSRDVALDVVSAARAASTGGVGAGGLDRLRMAMLREEAQIICATLTGAGTPTEDRSRDRSR